MYRGSTDRSKTVEHPGEVKKVLRLGVIGMSEGNGHPYSWSAIVNGYDADAIADCPFPVIPRYLNEHEFPREAIAGARVTHVWTQEAALSRHIAKSCLIDHVVADFHEMIGQIDAVLLARDDADKHLEMARPFLEAGLPVYIDKPIALSLSGLESLFALERYPGQIFSCTALRFSEELALSAEERLELGDIGFVQGTVPKSWERYGIHIVEPAIVMLGKSSSPSRVSVTASERGRVVVVGWEDGTVAVFSALPALEPPIALEFVGENGSVRKVFSDPFQPFKAALETFVEGIVDQRPVITRVEHATVVSILERGMNDGR
jgi:predicted dehydrogenase